MTLNKNEMRVAPIGVDDSIHMRDARTAILRPISGSPHPYLDEMADMYRNGQSLAKIGNKFGLTRERVRQILEAGKVSRRSPGAYQRIQREAWLEDNADAVDASWDRHHHAGAVVDEFAAQGIPSTWVRLALGDRVNQSIARPRPNMKRRSDEELLAHIAAAAKGGTTLTQSAYVEYRKQNPSAPTSATLANRFGSWNAAVEEAGLVPRSPNRASYRRKWTADQVRSWVVRFVADCRAEGVRPSAARYERWQREHEEAPSLGLVRLRVGSWADLLKEVM